MISTRPEAMPSRSSLVTAFMAVTLASISSVVEANGFDCTCRVSDGCATRGGLLETLDWDAQPYSIHTVATVCCVTFSTGLNDSAALPACVYDLDMAFRLLSEMRLNVVTS
ncbi:hypothetical protein DE146DRAFT_647128 [Phaeosphaeria sp. MPI-PUGE-AT-0046c]|nr:hypothetical protein DE146DRAFT_647128 [Phaeosphaeria sp. MPI-PUGE-AT-0046c]